MSGVSDLLCLTKLIHRSLQVDQALQVGGCVGFGEATEHRGDQSGLALVVAFLLRRHL